MQSNKINSKDKFFNTYCKMGFPIICYSYFPNTLKNKIFSKNIGLNCVQTSENYISEELELEQIIRQDGKVIELRFDSVDKIYNALVEILLGQLANPDLSEDDVSLDSNFMEDLKADSLDLIEMVVAIEECFDVTVPDDLTFKIRTMQQAVDVVLKLREAKGFVHAPLSDTEDE